MARGDYYAELGDKSKAIFNYRKSLTIEEIA
jgi:predicted negative regulator of RcsB-dependent stress response